jgi:alpha-L-fucosidase
MSFSDCNRLAWKAGVILLGVMACAGLACGASPPDTPRTKAAEGDASETRSQHAQRMAWWREARFGMFIHWGIMSIPGKDCAVMNSDQIPVAEYEKLLLQYNPVRWNPREVVRLAKESGQKYLVLVAKHHDGFAMWDSKVSDYTIMRTPYGKDIVRQLADQCAAQGIVFGLYYSILDWHHPQAHGAAWPQYAAYMKAQLRELLTHYGPIGVVWFDGEWAPEWTESQGRELARFVRSLQPRAIINNRVGKGRAGMAGFTQPDHFTADFDTPEQQVPATLSGGDWESCITINGSWSWNRNDVQHKSTADCIRLLVDTASKGGNLLLNIGPHPDGSVLPAQEDRLRGTGRWLQQNSAAIYGTAAGPFRRPLAWGRATAKGQILYLHVFQWPASGELRVPKLSSAVTKAYLLADATRRALPVSVGDQLTIHVPSQAPDPVASVVVLELAGRPEAVPFCALPDGGGKLVLAAEDADIHGATARYPSAPGQASIGYWTNLDDWVSWPLRVPRAGKYRVEITYGCNAGQGGGRYIIEVGRQKLRAQAHASGGWFQRTCERIGEVDLSAGPQTLAIRLQTKPGEAVMDLCKVVLYPVL